MQFHVHSSAHYFPLLRVDTHSPIAHCRAALTKFNKFKRSGTDAEQLSLHLSSVKRITSGAAQPMEMLARRYSSGFARRLSQMK